MRGMPRNCTKAARSCQRQNSELLARMAAIRLLCCVSILRTALTSVIPLAGAASWWVAVLCLLPGLAVYLTAIMAMRLTGTATLTDCVRQCLGRIGGLIEAGLLAALLLWESIASMTALVTMFTEGIGTRGTQITMALLTGSVLLLCLHREGLPRAIVLLRPVLLAAALLLVILLLPSVHVDGLSPAMGDGETSIRAAVSAGFSMGWPLLLLLSVPGKGAGVHSRSAAPVIPVLLICGLVTVLVIPHELLAFRHDLAGTLLNLTLYAPTAVQTLHRCLLMLALFLSTGVSVLLLTGQVCAPAGHMPGWLPGVTLLAVTASQVLNISELWRWLGLVERWLLLPLAVLVCLCIPLALFRRKAA